VRPVLRPTLGGLLVGSMAILTPEVLSSGHGALHISSALAAPLSAIALLLVLKSLAAIVTLGTGFRGGLFFASLLIGALGGRISPMRCGPPARSIHTAMRSSAWERCRSR
jgi:CIC family chloride channel protein